MNKPKLLIFNVSMIFRATSFATTSLKTEESAIGKRCLDLASRIGTCNTELKGPDGAVAGHRGQVERVPRLGRAGNADPGERARALHGLGRFQIPAAAGVIAGAGNRGAANRYALQMLRDGDDPG